MKYKSLKKPIFTSKNLKIFILLLTVIVFVETRSLDGSNEIKKKHHRGQEPKHRSHNYVSLRPFFENSKLPSSTPLSLTVNSKKFSEPKTSNQQEKKKKYLQKYKNHYNRKEEGYLREKRRIATTGAFQLPDSASLISTDIMNKIMGALAKNDSGEYNLCFVIPFPLRFIYFILVSYFTLL